MEDLLEFSFERIGKLAAARGVEMSDERKAELWQYVARMKVSAPWIPHSSLRHLYSSDCTLREVGLGPRSGIYLKYVLLATFLFFVYCHQMAAG